jgi:hypothetical protein
MPRRLPSLLVYAALLFSFAPAHAAPLVIKFKNTSGHPNSQVYIGFVGGAPLTATNKATNAPLAKSEFGSEHWYTLDTLSQGVDLTSFSGRIYVGYGSPWNFTHAGYEPSPVNPSDPNALKRYDKVEITYHGNAADVANATSFDYFSIPVGLNVYQGGTGGTLVKSLHASPTSVTLAAMETIATPHGAAVVRDGSNNFVRVIGPSVYPPPPGLPASPYDNFDGYLNYLHTYGQSHGGAIARIKGRFHGLGGGGPAPQQAQDYDFTATIDAQQNVTLTGHGTLVGNHTLTFHHDELNNPAAIYGANPHFQLDGAPMTPQNDLYGWIIADLFAGLNIGALGSNIEVNGQQVGQMESQQWFALTQRFASLQPSQPYYNQWAAKMSELSDAYNFAYTDRFAHVVAPLNPAQVDTLELVFLRETGVGAGNPDLPEPASAAILTLGAVLMLTSRRAGGRFRRVPLASCQC